jgi:hypothetical protein
MLLYDESVIEEIREEIKEFVEFSENENTIYKNSWDTARAVLMGKFIAMSAYIKKQKDLKKNDLMLHFKLKINKNKLNPNKQKERKTKGQNQ